MSSNKSRLLILSCSERKKDSIGLLPALSRYDGPTFSLVRKFLRENPEKSQALDIYILSAEFGLIPSDFPIKVYDRRMDQKRADQLRPETIRKISKIVRMGGHKEVFVNLGKEYSDAVFGLTNLIPSKITFAQGSYGGRLAALQKWLYKGRLPNINKKTYPTYKTGDKVMFRGIEINLSCEQILETAKNSLNFERAESKQYQAWYVLVDKERVSTKWLVSQLTGLPVNSFHSSEARRLLESLGMRVNHL